MITVSLETAKKLKEAGWKKETYFVWVEGGKLGQPLRSEVHPTEVMKNRIVLADSTYDSYLAPTAQEIIDELKESDGSRITVRREPLEDKYFFCAGYLDLDGIPMSPVFSGAEMAEALALLRLRCKDNGYLSS